MTPQSNVLVIAPIRTDREPELRHLLGSKIHFAPFVTLDDHTTGDLQTAYGVQPPAFPLYLA